MKSVRKNIDSLCQPAFLYFLISVISMVAMMIQNLTKGKNVLCLGEYQCTTATAPFVFLAEGVYILFWTKIIDILCKRGMTNIAWFLVLFPYILMFILIGLFMLNLGVQKKEVHVIHNTGPIRGAYF